MLLGLQTIHGGDARKQSREGDKMENAIIHSGKNYIASTLRGDILIIQRRKSGKGTAYKGDNAKELAKVFTESKSPATEGINQSYIHDELENLCRNLI